ncbi:MAG: SPOR domain-containing protein [Pseudomonadota bacterium]
MARAISDEELQLKKRARRRLVGANVLETVVAVVLPMVLDSEPRQASQNVDIDIPPSDAGELKPKAAGSTRSGADNVPLKGMPPPTSAKTDTTNTVKAEVPARIDDPGAAKDDDKTEGANKAGSTQPAKEGTKPRAAATDQKGATGSSKILAKDSASAYVVQVAALADEVRAKELQKQMTDAGIKTYTEVVATKSGEVTRVRAGPYATRDAAESARVQLKKAGLDGTVAAK